MATTSAKRDTRTRDSLVAEIEFLRRGGWANQVGPTVRTALVWGTVGFLGWCAKESIVGAAGHLAGKTTAASVVMDFLYSVSVSVALAWTVGTGGVAYGLVQKHLRKKAVLSLSNRNAKLEAMLDPKRTSSHLTPRGDTNPADKE